MMNRGLFADVTPVWSPDRAEQAIFGMMLSVFLANQGKFCDPGATLRCKNPLFPPNNFT